MTREDFAETFHDILRSFGRRIVDAGYTEMYTEEETEPHHKLWVGARDREGNVVEMTLEFHSAD